MTPPGLQSALLWILLGLLVLLLYLIVKPFLVPLVWAVVMVVFLFPVHQRLAARLRRPNLSALCTVSLVTVGLVVPFALLVPAFISETISFFRTADTVELFRGSAARLDAFLLSVGVKIPTIGELIGNFGQEILSVAAKQSAQIAGSVAMTLFELAVMLLAMFYLFRDGPALVRFLSDITPLSSERQKLIFGETTDMIRVTMSSAFVVAAAQGAAGGLVYWILGLPSPVFWGGIIAILSLLPVIGTWLAWGPMAIVLLFSGQTVKGITLLVLGTLLIAGVDNILRPVLISGRAQMNGLLIFISLLGGVAAFGFLGVVLGPVLVATFVGLLKGYRDSLNAS
ncbi:MAG: AI-2E family transporter [Bryobacteraceae bacterium]